MLTSMRLSGDSEKICAKVLAMASRPSLVLPSLSTIWPLGVNRAAMALASPAL